MVTLSPLTGGLGCLGSDFVDVYSLFAVDPIVLGSCFVVLFLVSFLI